MDLPTHSSSRSKSSSSKVKIIAFFDKSLKFIFYIKHIFFLILQVDEFPRRDVPAHNTRHKKFPDK